MNSPSERQQEILRRLQAQHRAQLAKVAAADPKEAPVLMATARETLDRVLEVQEMRLFEVTQELAEALDEVSAADTRLTAELQSAANAAAIVGKVSDFLAVVDKAIAVVRGQA